MVATVISGSTPYCTVAQFVQFADWRLVAQFLDDQGRQPPKTDLLDATTDAGAKLAALLQAASGEWEAALLVGHRYEPADLAALAGTNSGLWLAMMVARTAAWRVIGRRQYADRPVPADYAEALAYLDRLRKGDRIFGLLETQDAGNLQDLVEPGFYVDRRNLAVVQANRLFGDRGDRWQ